MKSLSTQAERKFCLLLLLEKIDYTTKTDYTLPLPYPFSLSTKKQSSFSSANKKRRKDGKALCFIRKERKNGIWSPVKFLCGICRNNGLGVLSQQLKSWRNRMLSERYVYLCIQSVASSKLLTENLIIFDRII